MLALKLLLVPTFIGLVSLAAKRWGPGVGGWLSGFPIVVGSILFFLAMEKGNVFAVKSATISLLSLDCSILFMVVYAHACLRFGWFVSIATALIAWFAAVSCIVHLSPPPLVAAGISAALLQLAPWLLPKAIVSPISKPMSTSELIARMVSGAVLTVLATLLAARLGAAWSGVAAAFPILLIILAIFCHRANGPEFVVVLFGSALKALYSFVAFSLCLGLLLPSHGLAFSFSVATVAAALVQWATKKSGTASEAAA